MNLIKGLILVLCLSAFGASPLEQSIIDATNANRQKYGLQPLELDNSLMETASNHCAWMTRNGLIHTRLPVAENIAWGQSSVSEVMNSWMNSSGHRANILGRRYNRIGVAAYRDGRGRIFWCQQFK
jgi:uncharacterized protein YkwD